MRRAVGWGIVAVCAMVGGLVGAATPAAAADQCDFVAVGDGPPGDDTDADTVAISVELRCRAGVKGEARVKFTAASASGSEQFATAVLSSGGPTTATKSVKVCAVPDASDLPGARVTLLVQGGLNGAGGESAFGGDWVLGPDTAAPKLTVHSSPAKGAKVSPGDRIHVEVTASEARHGSWQTGVHTTQLTGPGGSLGDRDAGSVPKACTDKSWSQNLAATYKVARHPPPVIEICAITEDYVPNDATKCAHFYTADNVWESTYHGTSTLFTGTQTCHGTIDGTFSFAVAPDGKVTGTSTAQSAIPDCGVGTKTSTAPVFGNETARGFSVPALAGIPNVGLIQLRRTGDRARGTASYHDASNDFTFTFDAHCVTCG